MNKHRAIGLLPLLLAPLLTACVGTTGSGLVDFDAFASGPDDASGKPGTTHAYEFLSPYSGYTITLSQATLQIGAVYLDAAPCNGGSASPPCVNQEAATVAQVNGGVTGAFGVPVAGVLLDTLSPDPQPFTTGGSGIIQDALSAEVWLMTNPMGETDAIDDANLAPTIATVAGKAEKDGDTFPFTATVTIGQNRLIPAANPALPGENPICDVRIVRPICLTPPIEPEPGTSLHVQVDPKGWFDNVDFENLVPLGGPPYEIPDTNGDASGRNLFQGLESSSGVYTFSFQAPSGAK
jgi:hypothetical protein